MMFPPSFLGFSIFQHLEVTTLPFNMQKVVVFTHHETMVSTSWIYNPITSD